MRFTFRLPNTVQSSLMRSRSVCILRGARRAMRSARFFSAASSKTELGKLLARRNAHPAIAGQFFAAFRRLERWGSRSYSARLFGNSNVENQNGGALTTAQALGNDN